MKERWKMAEAMLNLEEEDPWLHSQHMFLSDVVQRRNDIMKLLLYLSAKEFSAEKLNV